MDIDYPRDVGCVRQILYPNTVDLNSGRHPGGGDQRHLRRTALARIVCPRFSGQFLAGGHLAGHRIRALAFGAPADLFKRK